jgi:hypothetical protein
LEENGDRSGHEKALGGKPHIIDLRWCQQPQPFSLQEELLKSSSSTDS